MQANLELWTRRDHALFAGLIALSVALLALAWYGAGGEVVFEDDQRWLNLAVTGMLVATVGSVRWFLVGRRSVHRLRRELNLDALIRGLSSELPTAEPADADHVVVPGLARYHRAQCHLVTGKQVEPMNTSGSEAADRQPCGVCRP